MHDNFGGRRSRDTDLGTRRVASGGQGGIAPPIYFLPPTVFFWEKKVAVFGRKNVKICDLGQKKPSDFGEELFFRRFSLKLCLNPIQEQ